MSISDTIIGLIHEKGLLILEQPYRLEGFLKDLHPDEERDVFLMSEFMFCGMLDRVRRTQPKLDSEIQLIVLQFATMTGIAVNYSDWAVERWLNILPKESYWAHQIPTTPWTGTLEELLRN
ncbi:MAG: hypothetical protein VX278_23235 [Myxococcota bacterium]|nr:hypothetical protein [Myxococcota bacterium]